MRAIGIILGLALHTAQAGGNESARPDSSARREPADLDFLVDSGPQATSAVRKTGPSRAWIYWATAGTAAAACGGLGWYWYQAEAKPAAPTRNYQVFSDER
jgi:hypothetical protein